jgi:hypothetical protein
MWKEEAMPHAFARVLQLDLFLSDAQTYRNVLARYETIRPVLRQERILTQHSRMTGLSYWRLWRDLRRFWRVGILGLIDRRTLPHRRGRPPIDARLPQHSQQHIVRLALAHPFTARELARIVRECSHQPIEYRGIQRVPAQHRLSPIALQRHHQVVLQAPLPSSAPTPQLALPLEPHTLAQRLALALGPEHLLLRFRTYDEYPTEEQARWRIIEWLEVGFRPRRVAKLLAIQPPVVYHWKRWFASAGLFGLTTRTRARTPLATRMPV